MNDLDALRNDVKQAKRHLIKSSKILLNALQQEISASSAEIHLLNERITFLEEELKLDIQSVLQENPGRRRLEIALRSLQEQLEVEKSIFEKEGLNADKVLDLNYRVQEIIEALQSLSDKQR